MRTFVLTLFLIAGGASAHSGNTLVAADSRHYAPRAVPDRIVALPAEDPATAFAVAWRTAADSGEALAQIAVARDDPDLAGHAQEVRGSTRRLDAQNGASDHHQVRFENLQPDTLYAWRVRGGDTWSEWFQIRTAAREARPFSFIYFGDAQNSVKSLFSRVIREAWTRQPEARLLVHAGDMVNSRDGNHDTEWGEWFEAGGFLHAMAFSVPAAGNHEQIRDAERRYRLGPHWPAQFAVPGNGETDHPHTTYWFDFQGVRFIVLDSSYALDHDTGAAQAAWLEPLLKDNPNRWTVVIHHHPMFSVSLGRDNPPLREHWKPLFDRYRVDLVLQGHDHVYGRGENLSEGSSVVDADTGTVYVVSVAGPKMYRVSEASEQVMTRIGEETQLYQVVRVDHERLRYESRTATGRLYDAFELVRGDDGRNRLVEGNGSKIAVRRCQQRASGSGRTDRCWDGVEW